MKIHKWKDNIGKFEETTIHHKPRYFLQCLNCYSRKMCKKGYYTRASVDPMSIKLEKKNAIKRFKAIFGLCEDYLNQFIARDRYFKQEED